MLKGKKVLSVCMSALILSQAGFASLNSVKAVRGYEIVQQTDDEFKAAKAHFVEFFEIDPITGEIGKAAAKERVYEHILVDAQFWDSDITGENTVWDRRNELADIEYEDLKKVINGIVNDNRQDVLDRTYMLQVVEDFINDGPDEEVKSFFNNYVLSNYEAENKNGQSEKGFTKKVWRKKEIEKFEGASVTNSSPKLVEAIVNDDIDTVRQWSVEVAINNSDFEAVLKLATACGSIQVFNFMRNNGVYLTDEIYELALLNRRNSQIIRICANANLNVSNQTIVKTYQIGNIHLLPWLVRNQRGFDLHNELNHLALAAVTNGDRVFIQETLNFQQKNMV